MSSIPINHRADLAQLRDQGFFIEVRLDVACLIVKEIPYVNADRKVKRGSLISKLDLTAERPQDHQTYFVGDLPCHEDGSRMDELVSEIREITFDADLVASAAFSRKLSAGYANYYEKMTAYIWLIASQAALIDPEATPQVYRVSVPELDESPFNYLDTASSRAEITGVTRKLKLPSVAIIGLGGTGSYVLDLVAKTPVSKIHIFDGDIFSSHNAFRAPGAASIETLRSQMPKVSYFKRIYSEMHRGIIDHPVLVDATNVTLLERMDFVFLCIDKNDPKRCIIEYLEASRIPFIDVGMGLYVHDNRIGGILRVTSSAEIKRNHIRDFGRISLEADPPDDAYDRDIQVADLNALNAALAVVKWKKLFAFYADFEYEFHSTYTIESNALTSDDAP